MAGQPAMVLGYPVTEAEDMPSLAANSLSLAFGNFREGYQIYDRIGIRTLRDPLTTKGYVKFYTTKRVGGGVVNFDAIKLMKFNS
jgi:HK97 family phage major capsid protein